MEHHLTDLDLDFEQLLDQPASGFWEGNELSFATAQGQQTDLMFSFDSSPRPTKSCQQQNAPWRARLDSLSLPTPVPAAKTSSTATAPRKTDSKKRKAETSAQSPSVALQRKRLRERERRDQLNSCVAEIGTILGIHQGTKRDKLSILKEALEKVKSLQYDNERLRSKLPRETVDAIEKKSTKPNQPVLLPLTSKRDSKTTESHNFAIPPGMMPCLVPWATAMNSKSMMFGGSAMVPMPMPWMNPKAMNKQEGRSVPSLTAKLSAPKAGVSEVITHSHCA